MGKNYDIQKLRDGLKKIADKSLPIKINLLLEKLREKIFTAWIQKLIDMIKAESEDLKKKLSNFHAKVEVENQIEIKGPLELKQPLEIKQPITIKWPKFLDVKFPPFPEEIFIKHLPKDIEVSTQNSKLFFEILNSVLVAIQEFKLEIPQDFKIAIRDFPRYNKDSISELKKIVEKFSVDNLRASFPRSASDPISVRLSDGKSFYEVMGRNFQLVFQNLTLKIGNEDGEIINPATQEKQDDIITAIGGIAPTARATTPYIYNVAITIADKEYSQALPDGTKFLKFWAMSTDKLYPARSVLKYCFTSHGNDWSAVDYIPIPVMGREELRNLNLSGKTLYFQMPSAPFVLTILAWT